MLRRSIPKRTCSKQYKNYGSFKTFLRTDFNNRCGYCDITDHIVGGKTVFQIDHFAPKKFDALVNKYSNLVYSCPSCNRAKWNDWPMPNSSPSNDGTMGYVDPCDAEYSSHLVREDCGRILAKTEVGDYMRKQLKLYLLKHRYLWMQDVLFDQISKIKKVLREADGDNPDIARLKNIYDQLSDKYFMYYRINWDEE